MKGIEIGILAFAAIVAVAAGCGLAGETKNQTTRGVFVDTAFTEAFSWRGEGFTGGDGTYSVVLPDGRTLWMFGDTFLGNVTATNGRIKTDPTYIRNSFVIIDGDSLITYPLNNTGFRSMMIPPEVTDGSSGKSEHSLWYWPGDAYVDDNVLHVFASKFSQEDHEDMWAFTFEGTELLRFTLPGLAMKDLYRFENLDSIHFGHAVYEMGDSLYIYGLKKERAYAARAPKGNVRAGWQFFDGKTWVNDAGNAAPMLEFTGSEQFSVFRWEDHYVLIMQEGDLGRRIYSFTSTTPYGPWHNKKMIFETPLPEDCGKCWTYNALAHPQFIEDNYLLISYNTNSMNMQDHYENASIYRPRFVRVPLEMITGE